MIAAVRARRRVLPRFSKWTFPFLKDLIASISRGEKPPSGPTNKVIGVVSASEPAEALAFKSSWRSPSMSQRIKSPW